MAAYRIYLAGAHLLLLSHVAHSFILLTANMEDVKKIARKFVSESLAEQIAEFVAKATEKMASNVSEENDKNANEFQNLLADDLKLRNVGGRQRYQKATRGNKDSDLSNNTETTKNNFVKAYQKSTTRKNWPTEDNLIAAKDISWEKEENLNSVQKYSREIEKTKNDDEQQVKYEHSKLDLDLPQQPTIEYEKPKVQYEQQKLKNEQPKVEYEQQQLEYETKPQTVQKKIEKRPIQENDRPKPDYDQLIQDDQQPKPDYEQLKPDYDLPKPDENQSKVSYEQTKHINKPKKQRIRKQKTNLKSKPTAKKDQDIIRPDQKTFKSKQTTTQKAIIESTVLYNDEAPHIRPPKRQYPLSRGYQLTGAKYKEPAQDIKNNLTAPVQPAIRGFDLKLTTKKERTEFDQYDNPNYPKYPKMELLATSGPVVLPKVPLIEPWWNKELPGEKLNKKTEVMTII